MKNLVKLMECESNEDVARELKLALYLYKDLLTDNNKVLLDEYTDTLLNVFNKKGYSDKEKHFSDELLESFRKYLLKKRKTEKTAYDYTKRIERICKEYKISVYDLFNRKSSYSINDLIGMYSKGGIKEEENKKKHNAPLSALKKFHDFIDNEEKKHFENAEFYLCDTEGFKSWEEISKHPYIIEIKGRQCKITFKENRVVSGEVSKIINDSNYNELICVFKKYKNILSHNSTSIIQSYPYGGVHSYSYLFEDQANYSGCATLFESNDRNLEEQAYKEYNVAIEKIIKQ